jgi:adenylate kinase
MNIIFLGPPGVGKGTQASKLVSKHQIPHISTGDMFRTAIKNNTTYGLEAQKFMEAGRLVPDEVTIAIVKERLAQDDCKKGYLLDGFPRTIAQAEALDKICEELNLPIQKVINLQADNELLIKRITGRRVCKNCGEIYHVQTLRSKVEGKCDKCGGELYQRADDSLEKVSVRLDVYVKQTKPLINYYLNKGLLVDIDALDSIDAINERIEKALEAI